MKILIFGTGRFWVNRKEKIALDDEIVGFVDNNAQVQGSELYEKTVYSPNEIIGLQYDYILIMAKATREITEQLLKIGVLPNKIITWSIYISNKNKGIIQYYKQKVQRPKMKKVLICSGELLTSGGVLAAIYIARALVMKNYNVTIATPNVDETTVNRINEYGINICVMKSLPYLFEKEIEEVKKYDYCIVNTLQLIMCANIVSDIIPTIWWLHEPSDDYCEFYKNVVNEYYPLIAGGLSRKIHPYAVSEIARKPFLENIDSTFEVKLLPFGVPELDFPKCECKSDVIRVGIIGNICKLKGQITVAKAIKNLQAKGIQFETWFIGKIQENDYFEEIVSNTKWCNCRFLGKLNREEMKKAISMLDVIVCSSLEETVSMAVVEGLMGGKVCVTTDKTGVAEYIINGKNGFVYQAGNEKELEKILNSINTINYTDISKEARATYENNFSMEEFSTRVEEEMFNVSKLFEV